MVKCIKNRCISQRKYEHLDKQKELEEGWNIYKGSMSMDEEKEGTFKIPVQKDLVSLTEAGTHCQIQFDSNPVSVSLIEIMRVCVHVYSYVCLFFFLNSIWNQETHGI